MPTCSNAVVHGSLDDGRYVTLKFATNSDDVLVALGHLDDIQPENEYRRFENDRGQWRRYLPDVF